MIVVKEKCYICGNDSVFSIRDDSVLLREATCQYCGASIRNSDTAKTIVSKLLNKKAALLESIKALSKYKILGTSSRGSIHSILRYSPNYIFGEYFDDVASGQRKNGILCIDLKNIPFADDYFDLIISEDVLEHVQDVDKAFVEINRVLKTGGHHIFTVHVHEARKTLDRTDLPRKIYHGDPLRKEGPLVVTDFGDDLGQHLKKFGMKSTKYRLHVFYTPEEITNADLEYDEYEKRRNTIFSFFKYNSIVFCATKTGVVSNEQKERRNETPKPRNEQVNPFMNQIAELKKWQELLAGFSQ